MTNAYFLIRFSVIKENMPDFEYELYKIRLDDGKKLYKKRVLN